MNLDFPSFSPDFEGTSINDVAQKSVFGKCHFAALYLSLPWLHLEVIVLITTEGFLQSASRYFE
jgi:hypothetical protein